MDKLVATSPCDGLLPLKVGELTVTECDPGRMTSVAPRKDKADALSAALEAAHGAAYPAPNRSTTSDVAQILWFSHGEAMLMGPAPDAGLAEHAALVDQSDAWAVVELKGTRAEDVLARLVPVDLRAQNFAIGHSIRSQIFHMTGSITRTGENSFQLMVFRSMAGTLVHDLKTAMEAVSARG